MSAVLAVLASLSYGVADFLGGLMGRRMPTTVVVLWSQAVGLVLALVAAVVFPAKQVAISDFGWGALAGTAGALGLYFLYDALARGRMAVVSPVAALASALVPMAVGLFLGERPLTLEWVGIILAMPAIWLVAAAAEGRSRSGLLYGLLAGTGFGSFFAAIAQTGPGSGFWPLVGARIMQVTLLALVVRRRGLGLPPPGSRVAVAAVGVGDMLANVFVLLAARTGLLTLVGVLASLYPAVTVLLAVWILSEPIAPRQRFGIALSLVAVALIAV